MVFSISSVPTANASRYLQQLCKHFGHKIPVSFTPEQGECRFSCGVARLSADADFLRIDIQAEDGDQLRQTEEVIESHLLRFAFREDLGSLTWRSAA